MTAYLAFMSVYLPAVFFLGGSLFPDSPAGSVFRFFFGV